MDSTAGILASRQGQVITAFAVIASYYIGRRFIRTWTINKRLTKAQQRKQQEIAQAIDLARLGDYRRAPDASSRAILSRSATELIAAMKQGEVSASTVLATFASQALRAQSRYNCLTEIFIHQAAEQALHLDKLRGTDSKTLGPLHGLPISLKDGINVAGYDATLGLMRYMGLPADQDCLLVEVLKRAGGVPFTKTNIPQTLISYECTNPLFGTTTNPWNTNYTPGGSSGGESALLAYRGSALGIGTDIGGSVRIPAHMAGIVALKPTYRRMTTLGFRASVPGQEAIPGVPGPMANRVDDLELLMRVVVSEEVWKRDHEIVPLHWDNKEYRNNGKLRIGYYTHDGFLEVSPACSRAVLETVAKLRDAGHDVIEFTPPNVQRGVELYYSLLGADNGVTITNQLEGERWEPYVTTMMTSLRLPSLLKKIIGRILPDKRAAALVAALGRRTTAATWALQGQRKRYRQEWFEAWTKSGLDVIITPVHAMPAIPHGTYGDMTFAACYTFLFNLLDLPAGVIPVTRVTESDTFTTKAAGMLEQKCRRHYDPVKQAGLPIGVQVVGMSMCDETVLRTMRIIEGLSPFRDMPPSVDAAAPVKDAPRFVTK